MNCRDSLCLTDIANEMVYPNKNRNPYIYENNNSICHELCKEIIEISQIRKHLWDSLSND